MKFRILVLLSCLAFSACFKAPGKGPWSTATGAEQFERLMWQSIRDQHWNEVENHLAAMFVGVDTHGKPYDRVAWVEHWKSMQVRQYSLGEMTVQPNGADMVVTYEAHLSGEGSGQPLATTGVRVLSVWQQLKKGWVMIEQTTTSLGA
jgi:ketosteroid isomerase-like protein